jgi:hypothetical protein
MPKRRYSKKGGANEEEENPMDLSSIHGDETFDLNESLPLTEFDDEPPFDESNNTTMESIVPFEDQSFDVENETPESLHLSDLDLNTSNNTSNSSVNTTQESIGGKIRRRTKTKKGKKSKKTKKTNKKSTKKTNKKSLKKKSQHKTKKNKKGGQEDTLPLSIEQNEKQILPRDENPAY